MNSGQPIPRPRNVDRLRLPLAIGVVSLAIFAALVLGGWDGC